MPALRRLGVLGIGLEVDVPEASFKDLPQLQSLSIERFELMFSLLHPYLALQARLRLTELSFTAHEVPQNQEYIKQILEYFATLEALPTVRTVLLRQPRVASLVPGRQYTTAILEAYLAPAILPNLSRVVWISKAAAEACPLV